MVKMKNNFLLKSFVYIIVGLLSFLCWIAPQSALKAELVEPDPKEKETKKEDLSYWDKHFIGQLSFLYGGIWRFSSKVHDVCNYKL